MLAASPRIGHKYETTRDKDSILVWPVGNYLIFYRYHKEWVEIIGVTQGARDIPAFLSERS